MRRFLLDEQASADKVDDIVGEVLAASSRRSVSARITSSVRVNGIDLGVAEKKLNP